MEADGRDLVIQDSLFVSPKFPISMLFCNVVKRVQAMSYILQFVPAPSSSYKKQSSPHFDYLSQIQMGAKEVWKQQKLYCWTFSLLWNELSKPLITNRLG